MVSMQEIQKGDMQTSPTNAITKYFKDVQRLLLISKFSPPSDLMPFPLDDSVLLALCVSLIFDSDETCVLFTSQWQLRQSHSLWMNSSYLCSHQRTNIVRGQDVHSQTTVLCKWLWGKQSAHTNVYEAYVVMHCNRACSHSAASSSRLSDYCTLIGTGR